MRQQAQKGIHHYDERRSHYSRKRRDAESKGAKILELIGRPKGASLAEIQTATDWQAHSVRGFLSTAAKKHDLENTRLEASTRDSGDTAERLATRLEINQLAAKLF